MGVDLKLLPVDHENEDFAFSHTVLSMARDSKLFKWIENRIEVEPAPKRFQTYVSCNDEFSEPHYGTTNEDRYGQSVRTTSAKELRKAIMLFENQNNLATKNKAVLSYLRELDEDQKVALFWH